MKEVNGNHLTYGEAVQLEVDSMELNNGLFKQTVTVTNKRKPLSKVLDGEGSSPAGRYYTQKAFGNVTKVETFSAMRYLPVMREKMQQLLHEAYEAGRNSHAER